MSAFSQCVVMGNSVHHGHGFNQIMSSKGNILQTLLLQQTESGTGPLIYKSYVHCIILDTKAENLGHTCAME